MEIGLCGFPDVAKAVLYNVSNSGIHLCATHHATAVSSIPEQSAASRPSPITNLSDKVRGLTVDMYGPVKARLPGAMRSTAS